MPRPSSGGAEPDSLNRVRATLAKQRKALGEAGLNVLFVVNSVCIDNYWSARLKRLVNGQPGKRGDFLYLGDLKHGLWVLSELARSRREVVSTGAPAAE